MGDKKDFDYGMHYFRGFAIVCIVLVHAVSRLGYPELSKAFLTSSTIFFLFISGYLCQYLDLKRPTQCLTYYRKKVQNVLAPYLLWSILTFLAVWLLKEDRLGVIPLAKLTPVKMFEALLNGGAQTPYWYIPFVCILFAVSPLILKAKNATLIALTLVALSLAILFPYRGGVVFKFKWPHLFYRYTYFTIYYLLGFVYARYRVQIDPWLKRLLWPATCGGLFIGLMILFPGFLKLQILPEDGAAALQKLFFLVPVLVVSGMLRNRKILILDMLATYSFTLFFWHDFFLHDLARLKHFICGEATGCFPAVVSIFLLVGFLLAMLLVASGLKKVLGRHSRSVLGA